MGALQPTLNEKLVRFINEQKVFFVGTATADSSVSVSPKGMDCFRVLDDKRAIWLNLTGSGNETAAHVQQNPRMTIMFCSFTAEPMILRLYGAATVVHRNDAAWSELLAHFPPLCGPRQIFDLAIHRVQTSCGFGAPLFAPAGDRTLLDEWAVNKGEDGVRRYWRDNNQHSIDGIPTHIVEKNG